MEGHCIRNMESQSAAKNKKMNKGYTTTRHCLRLLSAGALFVAFRSFQIAHELFPDESNDGHGRRHLSSYETRHIPPKSRYQMTQHDTAVPSETFDPGDDTPSSYDATSFQNDYSSNNTTTSKKLPSWLREYLVWHQEQRKVLLQNNNTTYSKHQPPVRILVMTCLKNADFKCGDLSSRLKPLLPMLHAAYLSRRVLLIHWNDPFPLEEFLEPPHQSDDMTLDWRVPENMIKDIQKQPPTMRLQTLKDSDYPLPIVTTNFQAWDHGGTSYRKHQQQNTDQQQQQRHTELTLAPAPEAVFANVWNRAFRMVPPLQQLFDITFASLGLEPGTFATIDAAATVANSSNFPKVQARNALNCASQLQPTGPFLVLPSSSIAQPDDFLQHASHYAHQRNVSFRTVSFSTGSYRHIGDSPNTNLQDYNSPITARNYYVDFVEVYLLAQSKCVAIGSDDFGDWARLLGSNHSCYIRHAGKHANKCKWRENLTIPQESLDDERSDQIKHPVQATGLVYNPKEHLWDSNLTKSSGTNNIPDWLKQYFQWHKEQRATLTEDNFHNHRYMVMMCRHGAKCGGMTDRLRPILAELQVAYKTSRLFFIYWERPFALEEYLVPPQGGLDWRTPSFLIKDIRKTHHIGNLELINYEQKQPMITSTMYQSWNYGEALYNERKAPDEPEAVAVLRDVWNILFTPSPPVQHLVQESFHGLGLVPGHYVSTHVRALYSRKNRSQVAIYDLVTNALNCASQLQPGGPFFFVADSMNAVQIAQKYAASKNVTLVVPSYDGVPLHLGLHNESDTTIKPDRFYNVFRDMYLLAETRCTVVGQGGFGRWGVILGHDPHCHRFSNGFKAERCEWKDADTPDDESSDAMVPGDPKVANLSPSGQSDQVVTFHQPILTSPQ